MERVRVKTGAPIADDFRDKVGTPIVIDDATGNTYIFINGVIFPLNAAGSLTAWTPVLTFATPGDLVVAYAAGGQQGTYARFGKLVFVQWTIQTSTFTKTTAAGSAQITGLPFTSSSDVASVAYGPLNWQGLTMVTAAWTQVVGRVSGSTSTIFLSGSGSAVSIGNVQAADMPSGGTVFLRGSLIYVAA